MIFKEPEPVDVGRTAMKGAPWTPQQGTYEDGEEKQPDAQKTLGATGGIVSWSQGGHWQLSFGSSNGTSL